MFPAPFLAVVQTWPFVVLATSMIFLIFAITKLRMHAFIALIAAAILAGLMAGQFTPDAMQRLEFFKVKSGNHWVATLELAMLDFGKTAGDIAISIGLASIIGMALMESGAADKVVRRFLAFFGEQRAGIALLASTYFLSIPIFFDTMFMLMVPLARALRLRTGKDYVFYLMCICVAGVVTHSLTVPHPGPLKMVDNLHVDAGLSIWWGIIGGILPCVAGFFVARWIGRRVDVPLRETRGTSLDDLKGISAKPETELPSFVASILPIVVPIALISSGSFYLLMGWKSAAVEFIGNKNIALLIGTVLALAVLARQKRIGFSRIEELIGAPLETAGVIILITAAGGAFGAMLRNIGVGDAIKSAAQGHDVNLLLLAWVTAAVIRIAQGSATVAMITTSAIIWDIMDPAKGAAALPFNHMYVFLAIGFGAFACSWMNDSGFWVVSRLGGMTERETLRSWTVLLTGASVAGLALTLLFARILPLAS